MLLQGKRGLRARLASLAVALAASGAALGPAAATVVYCIDEAGHSGFELLVGGGADCAGCCDELDGTPAGSRAAAANDECTDVLLTLPQDLPRSIATPAGVAAPSLPLSQPAPLAMPCGHRPGLRSQTDLAPPASSPTVLIAFTILTI